MIKKKAVLSLDVEDWYHLDYFDRSECDTSISLLDGLDVYVDLISELSLPSSFFVLGEIAEKRISYFKNLINLGHDVGSHGWDHKRPLTMSIEMFKDDLYRSFDVMKKINGDRGFGYRAPCFSLDRERLDIIKKIGFSYDSSRIDFGDHPLYGSIDMSDYKKHTECIYQLEQFIEFEATTSKVLGKNIPISGGGYLRLFPWVVMRELVKRYLKNNDIYILYIHPFELSSLPLPDVPVTTSFLTNFRFGHGRRHVIDKLKSLIDLLHLNDYEFTTFSELHQEIIIKRNVL